MAVYFPCGQQSLSDIRKRLQQDFEGVAANDAHGLTFVTNQELTRKERAELESALSGLLDPYHLERVTTVLDQPRMGPVRWQFSLEEDSAYRLEALQTGGDTYAYVMLYHLDMSVNIAQQFGVIRKGEFPLYDLSFRITDMDLGVDVARERWGELNSPADFKLVRWQLLPTMYYRVFFGARNGQWHQDPQLHKSDKAECWLAATRVDGHQQAPDFQHLDSEFVSEFGDPQWRP
ncbi:MAG TPA: hypothetical protein VME70_14290 [Mycobacteriales bacterium]|nr:hypothetical protein [Mycobacteriales bacterium]